MITSDRIGGAPITWGVCEVPGWGVMLPADRVLAEMHSLGIAATELGAPGFLPRDVDELNAVLDRHDMQLIGGFVPVVLHDRDARHETLADAKATADLFAAAGATMFVSTAVVDLAWAPRFELSAAQWDHLVGMLDELDELCDERGMTLVLHPHVGTLVQTRADVSTVLERSDVRWCLDTGHLVVGGYDPDRFAVDATGRVGHVHLKDVDADVAGDVRTGKVTIRDAVVRGLFCPLGTGDAPIYETIERLESAGYGGWYVLEQDTDLGASPPAPGTGPIASARTSLDYLRGLTTAAGATPQAT
ncbi:MAG: sugar phosphate isomerase/epimerase family protein [Acidimicrobiales bacterium]